VSTDLPPSDGGKRLRDVVPKVVLVFDSDAQSDKARDNASGHPNVLGNEHVAGVERTFDQGFNAAKARGLVDDVQVPHELERRIVAAFDDESHHPGPLRHRSLSDFVIGMALELRVIDAVNLRMGLQPPSDFGSILANSWHADIEGSHAPFQQVAGVGIGAASKVDFSLENLRDQVLAADNGTANEVRMAAEVLRG